MYICHANLNCAKELIKCQTYKICNIVGSNAMKHFVKEKADISRNPFRVETLIDCDKLFKTDVMIPSELLTTSRRDVCEELFAEVVAELRQDGYVAIPLERSVLQSINGRLG
jgi:hypothetical protein